MKRPSSVPSGAAPGRSRWASQRIAIALGGVMLVVGAIAGRFLPRSDEVAEAPSTRHRAPAAVRSGPWGAIEITPFWLAPSELAVGYFQLPDQSPVWRLPGESRATVAGLLRGAGLEADAITAFMTPDRCFETHDGVLLLPGIEQLLGLPQPARQTIYERLSRLPGNPFHKFPLMSALETTSWLDGFALSGGQRHAFVKLLWRRGSLSAFSDPAVLVQLATNPREVAEVMRLLGRTPSLRVRVGPGAEPAAFFSYWSAGGRNREIVPLLRSLAASGADAVDVSLLLPPLGRERLYTYPGLDDAIGGQLPDCNWSTLSFFADPPRRFLLEPRAAGLEFERSYVRIPALSELGDVACFTNSGGGIEHSCVHVADDIVFTKNGVSPLAPWVLQRFTETAAIYGERLGNTVGFFRLKAEVPGNGRPGSG